MKGRRHRWVLGALAVLFALVLAYDLFHIANDLRVTRRGGTRLDYRIDLSLIAKDRTGVSREVRTAIARRLELYGVSYATVELTAEDRFAVLVSVADDEELGIIREQIEQVGNLRFQLVEESNSAKENVDRYSKQEVAYLVAKIEWVTNFLAWKSLKNRNPSLTEKAPIEPSAPEYIHRQRWDRTGPDGEMSDEPLVREALILINRPDDVIDGSLIKSAGATFDQNGRNAIAFTMSDAGAAKLGGLTGAHKKQRLAIVLDARVISAPMIQSRITTNGIITGQFTPQEVNGLVIVLNGGSLPAKPVFESSSKVDSFPFRPRFSWIAYAALGCLAVFPLCIAVRRRRSRWRPRDEKSRRNSLD
jgi:preprotein translocase subunit SecD